MDPKPTFQYLHLEGWPIFKQLQLEEALLRADQRNWCIVNSGSDPAIVLGISGKRELLIDEAHYNANPVPLIRRFSGGGTVFVDHNTLFITFICNSLEFGVPCFPKEILKWTESVYRPVFEGLEFQLRENDYALGDRKFGGNAQYLQKNRWLHHTTLLWDFDPQNMKSLKMPPKVPLYRNTRDHQDFLCKLRDHFETPSEIIDGLVSVLMNRYGIEKCEPPKAHPEVPHRKATQFIH